MFDNIHTIYDCIICLWFISTFLIETKSPWHQAHIWTICACIALGSPTVYSIARFNAIALNCGILAFSWLCVFVVLAGFLHFMQSGTPQELQDAPLNPSMTVSVVQGAPTAMNDGNVQPTDLSLSRFFGRVEGTLSASVSSSSQEHCTCGWDAPGSVNVCYTIPYHWLD